MTTVTDLINSAQSLTNNLAANATAAINQAERAIASLKVLEVDTPPAYISGRPDKIVVKPLVITSWPILKSTPSPNPIGEFQDIPDILLGVAPALSATRPTFSAPNKPNQLAEFSQGVPTINTSIAFPEPPPALLNPLIDAPTFAAHEVPLKPQVMLPTFDGTRPVDSTTAPTNLDVVLANNYAAAAPSFVTAINGYVDAMLAKHNPQYASQMAAIEAQLTKYLAGGTGLNSAAENAIYERARSKNNAEALRVRDAALNDMASRGFTMPSGALLSATQQARQAGADANAKAASEIVVMQAEMEQKNLQFAVTTSTGLRTTMLNATLSYMQNLTTINGQALDYAKSVLSSIVETYNVAVKAFTVKLDAYKADAQVFEVKLKGAMAYIELYTAEIKALEALVSVDRAQVDMYRARVETLVSLANVYRAQIEAVQGRASLEKLKLELFQTQVQSYTALVQAKNAEWQGYSAEISGEEVKAKIYSTQVQAYSTEVGAYSAKIGAQAEVVKAVAMKNQAVAEQYKAEVMGYQALVNAHGDEARVEISKHELNLKEFEANVRAEISSAELAQVYYKNESSVSIANAESDLRGQIATSENVRSYGQTFSQLATANAHIYGNLASSAMAGMNTLVTQSATV